MALYLDWLDYAVFGAMLIVSALIGMYFAFWAKEKQNSTAEYLMGGRLMGVFPISMSLIASYISGISILGIPAEIYVFGTMYWLIIVSEITVSITMAYVYIPVFYKLQITSSYEYLNMRFGKKVQILGTCLFIVKMMLYIPIVIYVPALAFNQVTGINLHIVTPIVCVICIFYTTLGGLKAVVWADTVQMMIMLLGTIIIASIGTYKVGISNIIERNRQTGRIEFNVLDLNPTIRHTVWSLVIGNYFYWLAACSVNQAMVQRCLSLPTKSKANFAIFNLGIGIMVLVSLCCYTGLVIFAYFHNCDPLIIKKISKSDQILPYFVMEIGNIVPGLPGIFVSGVFSAALSTMSTGLNSLTGVIFEDLIRPLIKKPLSEAKASFIMKIIVVLIGIFCVAMVFVVEHLGALVQAGKSLAGITAGPLLGLFTLGLFFPWANSKGAFVGGIAAVTTTCVLSVFAQIAIARGQIQFPKKPVSVEGCSLTNLTLSTEYYSSTGNDVLWIFKLSYLWYSFIGTTTVLIVGMAVSYLTGFNNPKTINRDLLTPVIHRYLPKQEKRNKSLLIMNRKFQNGKIVERDSDLFESEYDDKEEEESLTNNIYNNKENSTTDHTFREK